MARAAVTARRSAAQAADAATVAAVQWSYARDARSLADAALAGAREYVEWAHYPREDCVDRARGTRFYYHAHAARERATGEHGHFHLFAPVPGAAEDFCHLAGLSLDARGLPQRWFTTNRWVTGERWVPARRMSAVLAAFDVHVNGRMAPIARWLGAMVRLYAAELRLLLQERDELLQRHATATGVRLAQSLEDTRIHIVSQRPVDLLQRLATHDTTL